MIIVKRTTINILILIIIRTDVVLVSFSIRLKHYFQSARKNENTSRKKKKNNKNTLVYKVKNLKFSTSVVTRFLAEDQIRHIDHRAVLVEINKIGR